MLKAKVKLENSYDAELETTHLLLAGNETVPILKCAVAETFALEIAVQLSYEQSFHRNLFNNKLNMSVFLQCDN